MDFFNYGKKLYKLFHDIPEASGKETVTRYSIEKICSKLNKFKCIYNNDQGLVYSLTETGNYNYDLGFRAELDALIFPNTKCYHGCGHDAHITSLLLFMTYLQHNADTKAKSMIFIFQSSEEEGNGAAEMVEFLMDKKIRIEKMIGIHNAPEISADTIAIKHGPTLANNVTNRVKVKFKTMDRFHHSSVKNQISIWEPVYDMVKNLNDVHEDAVFTIGEFSTDGRIGTQAQSMNFTLSMRSNILTLAQLTCIFDEFLEKIKSFTDVDNIRYWNVNYHWRINNDRNIYNSIKNNSLFNQLLIPNSFTSDDFCYYERVSNHVFYFFVGNYISPEKSRIHSESYEMNDDFLSSMLNIYRYIVKEV